MIINSSNGDSREVTDYEFIFSNGLSMTMTVDESVGDSITIGETRILIHLTAKPSVNDPLNIVPAEDVIIYMPHVLSMQTRIRLLTPVSPEQRNEIQQTIQELANVPASKGIH